MTTGVGQHQMWAAQWTKFARPADLDHLRRASARWASASRRDGAAGRLPDALVVDIDGDGSFVMNIQELATIYCENLPVKVIVSTTSTSAWSCSGKTVPRRQPRHTYLGPSTTPRPSARARGSLPEVTYPRLSSTLARGLRRRARQIRLKSR
jgi:acetolactate synthase-1/2/3 large subunit